MGKVRCWLLTVAVARRTVLWSVSSSLLCDSVYLLNMKALFCIVRLGKLFGISLAAYMAQKEGVK
jgi:hypothetical protein